MALLPKRDSDREVERLLEEVKGPATGTFYRFRIPHQDREDLLQQVLLAFVCKRSTIEDPRKWLLGALRNRCRLYWRSRRRKVYVAVDRSILEAVAVDDETSQQEIADLRRDLDGALEKISNRCRRVLRLRYQTGCRPAEAAKQLGYATSGIHKILQRCLAALTHQLVAPESVTDA